MKEYFERLAATENAKRAAAYKQAIAGWLATSMRDFDLGLAPRPFPELPHKQVVVEVDGEFSMQDSGEYACAPVLTWGADGQTINVPVPARVQAQPLR